MSDGQILRIIIQKRVDVTYIRLSTTTDEYNYYITEIKGSQFSSRKLKEEEFKPIKEYVERWWYENI